MGWRDKIRKGSFRGVDFFIDTSKMPAGRRAVNHEFPNRETPYTEDLGRVSKNPEIEGHVIGDDYITTRDMLIDVFNKLGPGELIHPYYGSMIVQVGPVDISESSMAGAVAKFTAKFFEAGSNVFPKGVNDKGAILDNSVNNTLTKSKDNFDKKFSTSGMPSFSVDSARGAVSKAQKFFDKATKTFSDSAEGIANAAYSTRNLVAEVNDLLQSPGKLSQRLLDSFQLMDDAISNAKFKTDALSSFFNFKGAPDPVGVTPIRNKEKDNLDLFNNFMRQASASMSASSASITVFESFQEAEEQREAITGVIDEQLSLSDDNDLYQALADLNANLVQTVPDVDSDLPNIKEYIPHDTSPSLLIAYDLFEDQRAEQDIIKRNGIRHPGFIEARIPIDVLENTNA